MKTNQRLRRNLHLLPSRNPIHPGADAAPGYVIPSQFDERVAPAVAEAVRQAARADGVARR